MRLLCALPADKQSTLYAAAALCVCLWQQIALELINVKSVLLFQCAQTVFWSTHKSLTPNKFGNFFLFLNNWRSRKALLTIFII